MEDLKKGEIKVCYIKKTDWGKKSTGEETWNNLLESEIHEALRGFRIEEIFNRSLLEDVIRHQEQK